MKIAKLACIGLVTASVTQAAIWEEVPGRKWDKSWEDKYANWISNEVKPTFFKDLGTPYRELKLDCADAIYALKAYFARENKLPFAVNRGKLTNQTTQFDQVSDPNRRMARFLNHLRAYYGTESLAHRDTYPIAIKDVKAGDTFLYKVGTEPNVTRHSYIIKNINPDGTFDVMFSTQKRAADGDPLRRRETYQFKKAPVNTGRDYRKWGFKRMKPAHLSTTAASDIPGFSEEQYIKIEELGSGTAFFRYVKDLLAIVSESPQKLISRSFKSVCSDLSDRIGVVTSAREYVDSIGGACMPDYGKYDTYSTPSRDSGIKGGYNDYEFSFKEVRDAGLDDDVRSTLWANTVTVFNSSRTDAEKEDLYNACKVDFGKDGSKILKTDMGSFRDALFAGNVSFHPNDSLLWRWGIEDGERTTCKEYYGYPDSN